MSGHGLSKMSGKPQDEREANCRRRLATFRASAPAAQLQQVRDGLNYTFQGGFGGVFHNAKKKATDDRLSPAVRALFQEATDWGYAAFAAEKRGMTDLAAHFAVQATQAVSKATGLFALGWVGDAGQ